MVAVRRKVGARGQMRMPSLPKGKKIFKVDCSTPAQDDIMDADLMNAYQQYLAENIKLHGRKGKLGDKVKITQENNVVTVATTMAYRKRYVKYLTKKFLKKKNLRDWLRILATGKGEYTLKYFNIQDGEQEE
uniref:Large ribosomal subunit protein eL22 n=1 Tax=Neobodo designis TaxID=312471 RepID=A0A7S1QJ69_NEODS|mmetsp:Transcript_46837/g.144450  ORF Transcript_46837/g.144450 Transcript_46837/m.144450 type:complete len:132 (+) Transcript_46837:35-430(+)|eukprot:CAMPEP_0174833532 /NCGR_PEP_ID=MMETSP1114-20130205/4287_1 /TAXON_ID=312471 /ORGANISM="Neobodo designis, Strain CCAP 1951/1" /LENGTH=131 /DNA_ID=CAMNT_0016067415 /DNA_START=43 /DNA_END=438 /DNA_ORIENTATION=-